jgi:hypothetical protein
MRSGSVRTFAEMWTVQTKVKKEEVQRKGFRALNTKYENILPCDAISSRELIVNRALEQKINQHHHETLCY